MKRVYYTMMVIGFILIFYFQLYLIGFCLFVVGLYLYAKSEVF